MIVIRIISIIILGILSGDCPEGYQEYLAIDNNECFNNSNNNCYFISDLNVLNDLLDNNCLDFDQNGIYNTIECEIDRDCNEDGFIWPIEICSQVWQDGRLLELDCSESELIGDIPYSIGNLDQLMALNMNSNYQKQK